MWFITSTFTGKKLKVQQNASQFGNPPLLFPTLYASPLITLTAKGYTKHYFEEGRRVCSKIGGGGLDVIGNDEELQTKADMLFEQSIEQVNNRVLHENDLDCIMSNEFAREEFGQVG